MNASISAVLGPEYYRALDIRRNRKAQQRSEDRDVEDASRCTAGLLHKNKKK